MNKKGTEGSTLQTLSYLSVRDLGTSSTQQCTRGKSLLAPREPLHGFTMFSFQGLNRSFSVVCSLFVGAWK